MDYETKLYIEEQRSFSVYKANEIIQKARYDLNLSELKTFAYILSKIKPNDKENQLYEFTIKDYCQVCGIDYKNGGNYKNVKDTLKSLRDKSFWLMDENGVESTVGWLEKARISKGSGKIIVKLDSDIQKYVLDLQSRGEYTQYSLLSTLPMKSAYSFRMYELLKSYAGLHRHTFDVEDLKIHVGAQNYVNFKDFRKKVIEIAVKEINLYTDIEVSWEPINKGRKVIQVKFEIKQRDQWGRFINQNNAHDQIEGQMNMYDYFKSTEEYYK